MNFTPTEIPDVKIIIPEVYADMRGFFMETYQKERFFSNGIEVEFVQDNHSHSKRGVLRGLHYQVSHVQGKLVRVSNGEIFDIAVDLRKSSPTFGKWVGMLLSAENKQQLWIPPGFAHGFYTLSYWADIIYKTTDYYDADGDRCILWNDPELTINWLLIEGQQPILSEKDKNGLAFFQAEVFN